MQGLNRYRLFSMASEAKESPANNPGLQANPDEATKSYFMQQTVIYNYKLFLIKKERKKERDSSCTWYSMFTIKLWVFFCVYFDCRCIGLRIPKWALTSILASWACRKLFFFFFCNLKYGFWLWYDLYFVYGTKLHSFVILTWLGYVAIFRHVWCHFLLCKLTIFLFYYVVHIFCCIHRYILMQCIWASCLVYSSTFEFRFSNN